METRQAPANAASRDPASHQVLTFELGTETYGVEILRVIHAAQDYTRVLGLG